MEAQTTLVRPEGVAVLNAPAPVHLTVARIILPADPETDDAVGLGEASEDAPLTQCGLVGEEGSSGRTTSCTA